MLSALRLSHVCTHVRPGSRRSMAFLHGMKQCIVCVLSAREPMFVMGGRYRRCEQFSVLCEMRHGMMHEADDPIAIASYHLVIVLVVIVVVHVLVVAHDQDHHHPWLPSFP